MKKMFLIVFVLVQLVCRAEYDSTYVLSITQKYALPENVVNGDYVGKWLKTWTWIPVGTISYSMEQNYNSAFSIDSSTGLITVSNASQINGQVSQQDLLINLIIRTTDSGEGFELDTAKIWIKENAYCKFIDYDYSGTESGTRAQPYNDFSDITITAGYGYFIKRGNKPANKFYNISGFQATASHPTILSAYANGNNPEFDGSGLGSVDGLFYFLNTPAPPAYCYIYNIDVKNYPAMAFRVASRSSHFGFYNCNFQDNILVSYKADLGDIYLFGSASDSLTNWGHELINLESKGSWGPILKTDASGVYAYNIKSATGNQLEHKGYNFRFAISYYSRLSHFHFTGGARSLQTRYPYTIITDGIITNSLEGGIFMVTDATYNGHPDRLMLKNVLFKQCEYGIYVYNTEINKITIEDCRFEANTNDGIYFKNGGKNWTIQRSSFINNGGDGLDFNNAGQASTGTRLNHNLFYGNGGMGIRATASSCVNNMSVINNTVDGVINCLGAQLVEVRNNYFRSITSAATASNNIDLDTITTSSHFQNYVSRDYRLKSTAFSAINKGFSVSLTSDMAGTSIPQGSGPDIGAYEYKGGLTSNSSIQRNNQKGMNLFPNPTTGIVHIRFDNFTENAYQSEWLKVTDLYGRSGFQKTLGAFLEGNQGKLDLSGLPKGFYMICLGNRMVEKLVLQ